MPRSTSSGQRDSLLLFAESTQRPTFLKRLSLSSLQNHDLDTPGHRQLTVVDIQDPKCEGRVNVTRVHCQQRRYLPIANVWGRPGAGEERIKRVSSLWPGPHLANQRVITCNQPWSGDADDDSSRGVRSTAKGGPRSIRHFFAWDPPKDGKPLKGKIVRQTLRWCKGGGTHPGWDIVKE